MKFTEDLVERLQDKKFAAEYIHEIIAEFGKSNRREALLTDALEEIHSNTIQHLNNDDTGLSSLWLIGLIDRTLAGIGEIQ